MASREEVAAAAGVSIRTVSNVVSGFRHVAPSTRERVLEAIERLDYHPSELARSLRTGRSGLVGLMLPDLDVPYFSQITRAFVEQGAKRGLTVVIDQTDGDRDRELSWMRRAANGSLFEALILHPLGLRPEDVSLVPDGVPVVFVGEQPHPGFDQVMVDSVEAATVAVDHLIGLGRKRIAFVGDQGQSKGTSAQRLAGYRNAMRKAGLTIDDDAVVPVEHFTRTAGYESMARLLELPDPPDAVFCVADPLALGALRALADRGVRVPEEIAVAGFDDIEDGRFSTPRLTSISPDKNWLAEAVFDRLLMQMRGEEPEPQVILAPYELVVRESTVG